MKPAEPDEFRERILRALFELRRTYHPRKGQAPASLPPGSGQARHPPGPWVRGAYMTSRRRPACTSWCAGRARISMASGSCSRRLAWRSLMAWT